MAREQDPSLQSTVSPAATFWRSRKHPHASSVTVVPISSSNPLHTLLPCKVSRQPLMLPSFSKMKKKKIRKKKANPSYATYRHKAVLQRLGNLSNPQLINLPKLARAKATRKRRKEKRKKSRTNRGQQQKMEFKEGSERRNKP